MADLAEQKCGCCGGTEDLVAVEAGYLCRVYERCLERVVAANKAELRDRYRAWLARTKARAA